MLERLIADSSIHRKGFSHKSNPNENAFLWADKAFCAGREPEREKTPEQTVLSEEGLLAGSRRAKSVWLTEEGEEAAKFLLKYYGLEFSGQKKTGGRVVPLPEQKK